MRTCMPITRRPSIIPNRLACAVVPALMVAVGWLAAPTSASSPSAAAYQHLRALDVRDAAEQSSRSGDRRDLRSQDELDAARSFPPDQLAAVAAGLRSPSRDLRSQDELDAARSLPPDQLVAVSEGLRSASGE